MHQEISSIILEGQLEEALEDIEDIGTPNNRSWKFTTSGNTQHSSFEYAVVQLNRYEALASDKKPTPISGEAKACTHRRGGIKTAATKRKQ